MPRKHCWVNKVLLLPLALLLMMVLGTACTPWYKAYDIEDKTELGRLSSIPALIEALEDKDASIRVKAAEALADIGVDARDAVPYLLDALSDENYEVRQTAADALEAIALSTPEAEKKAEKKKKPELSEEERSIAAQVYATRLESDNWITRRDAAYNLADLGEDAAPVVPDLIVALRDDTNWHDEHYNEVREAASTALGEIGYQARTANPALIETLENYDYDVRLAAAKALGKIGPKGLRTDQGLVEAEACRGVVEALTRLLDDPDMDVRREAVVALGNYEGGAVYALPTLITESLNDMDFDVRREAVKAVSRIQSDNESVAAALRERLLDSDPDVRREALIALRKVPPKSKKQSLTAITRRLDDLDKGVRMSAVKTLAAYEISTPQVCQALERVAKEEKSLKIKKQAMKTLIRWKKAKAERIEKTE